MEGLGWVSRGGRGGGGGCKEPEMEHLTVR